MNTPCLATHRIRQHITRPFNLQHGHLVLVQITEQLLDHGGVRTQHSGDEQNVHLAVLQRQILPTGKLPKQEERALELSRFRPEELLWLPEQRLQIPLCGEESRGLT